jgi:hypothetical protein
MIKRYLILIIIVLIGSILRLQGVFTNSFAFTYDVGRDMLALWDIVHTHKPLLIGFTTGLPGVFYGPWWYYILLFPYILFFGNPQGIALVMAIIGIITIIFGFILGKKIGGYFLGISLASLISVSPQLVSLSSQIWNPNISPIFIILSLLILYKIFAENNSKISYYFFLGLLIALIIDLEIVFGILLAIGLVLALLIVKNKNIRVKSAFIFLTGAIIIFAPRIIFELRHQFIMTNSFIKFLTVSSASQNTNLIGSLINKLSIMFNQFNSTIALDNKFFGASILVFILISIMVLYRNASQMSKNFIKTSLMVLLIFLIGLTFFRHDIWLHYLVGLPIFYLLLFCLALNLIVEKTKNYIIPGIFIVILFLAILNPVLFISNQTKPIWIGDASVYRNQLRVVDYVYKQANGKSFKYVAYSPAVYDYPYQYHFKWYGPNKYFYSPSKNSHLAYFILEPDLQYPFRLSNWLKQREKDGKIIKTEKFESGIIVQTRIN